jgi:molecular chaperone GrpE
MTKETNKPLEEETLKTEEMAEETLQNEDNQPVDEVQEENQEELTIEQQLIKELENAQKEVEDLKDKHLRLSAEFDNYRKRTLKEKAELIKNGAEKTMTAILPILDDFERALKNMEASEETQAMREGVELIFNKFHKVLNQEGLQVIETEGKDFDTDFCEAIALIPATSDDMKGKILDCVQTGYMLNDKVIRHAKVVVAQ